jgi:hypothetical protein
MTPERTGNETSSFTSTMGLQDVWPTLAPAERLAHFRRLLWPEAEAFFLELDAHDQVEIISGLALTERRLWLRVLAPDDAVDVIQAAPAAEHEALLTLLYDAEIRRRSSRLFGAVCGNAGERDRIGHLLFRCRTHAERDAAVMLYDDTPTTADGLAVGGREA